MKLEALVGKVAADEPDRDRVRRTVLETVAAMGFYISHDGEVCDPRPQPAPSWDVRKGDYQKRARRRF